MVRPKIMAKHPSNLEIRRIVTDSDLDGVVTAAILGVGGRMLKWSSVIQENCVRVFSMI